MSGTVEINWTRKGYFSIFGPDGSILTKANGSPNFTSKEEATRLATTPGRYRIIGPEWEYELAFTIFPGSAPGTPISDPEPPTSYATSAVIAERNEQGQLTGNWIPSPSGVLAGYDPAVVPGVTGWSQGDTWQVEPSSIPGGMIITEQAGGRVFVDATGTASGSYLLTANMILSGNFGSKTFTVVVP